MTLKELNPETLYIENMYKGIRKTYFKESGFPKKVKNHWEFETENWNGKKRVYLKNDIWKTIGYYFKTADGGLIIEVLEEVLEF